MMSKLITCFLVSLLGTQLAYTQLEDQIVLGTKHSIHSDSLGEGRAYWVNLPESYHEEGASYKRYSVLILLDGHAHFRSISGMVNYLSTGYNRNRRIPEMIIVAVQNVNRRRDFTPDKVITRRKRRTVSK